MSNVVQINRKKEMVTLSDGVARPLSLTLNSLVLLEEHYGSVDAAFKALEGNKIVDVRFILYAALCGQFNSPEEVGDLIEIQDIERLSASLGKVADGDMPSEEEVAEAQKAAVKGTVSSVDPNA